VTKSVLVQSLSPVPENAAALSVEGYDWLLTYWQYSPYPHLPIILREIYPWIFLE
jgi:hypothetical protein